MGTSFPACFMTMYFGFIIILFKFVFEKTGDPLFVARFHLVQFCSAGNARLT
jgi:hypothetical protein